MNLIAGVIWICTLVNVLLVYGMYRALRSRLMLIQDDVSAVRMRTVPPNIGGRLPPSAADLQAARNRMDKLGVAHPGEPG